jgi:glycosyltransferase involved in cell wall biosynthesis
MKDLTIIIPAGEKTKIEAEKFIDKKEVVLIIERGKNPSKNRNRGVIKSKTKFVAFINAHTFLNKTWVNEVTNFFKAHPEIDIVGGPQLTSKDENLFGKASGYALSSKFGTANVSFRYKQNKLNLNADETMLTSANLICKKNIFKKIKFDETIYPGEDPKFIEDAKKAELNVAYSPEIIVYNLRRPSPPLLFKQVFNYGITRPQKESLIQTLKKPYFLIPSLLVLYLITLPSLILISKFMILPLLAYFFLDILFSFYESIKNKDVFSTLLLMLTFPIIHLSYGLGFLYGSLKKIWHKKNH